MDDFSTIVDRRWEFTQDESRSQLNRTTKSISMALADYLELQFVCHSSSEPKNYKRRMSKARRRWDRLMESTYGY